MTLRYETNQKPIYFLTNFKTVIYETLRTRPGWVETDSNNFNLLWVDKPWIKEHGSSMKFNDYQRVNHFFNFFELTRKDLLIKHINRARIQLRRYPDKSAEYDLCPRTYVLPSEYSMFVEEYKKQRGIWIMKPIGKSQGKGIFLITKSAEISEWSRDGKYGNNNDGGGYLVQKYIERPYCIGGKKFDMRIYCLVSSYSPLEVWLYRHGFCRFTNTRFSSDPKDIENIFMHLTNVAIQKKSETYTKDTKYSIYHLRQYLLSKHTLNEVNKLFIGIQTIILRSLFCVCNTVIQDKHCFELYGYDIIIDMDLRPWILEVNASPSMTASSQEDFKLKKALLNNVLDIVDLEQVRNGDETNIGEFDKIWDNESVNIETTVIDMPITLGSQYPSYL